MSSFKGPDFRYDEKHPDFDPRKVVYYKWLEESENREGILSSGVFLIFWEGKFGYINKDGVIVFPPKYQVRKSHVPKFSEGLMAQCEPLPRSEGVAWKKCGYVDTTGSTVIPHQFGDVRKFSEGLAAVDFEIDPQKSAWGYIDKSGHVVVGPDLNFQEVGNFSEGLAAVRVNGLNGFINAKGQIVIEPQYLSVYPFQREMAFVESSEGKRLYIDKNGKIIKELVGSEDWKHVFHSPFIKTSISENGIACDRKDGHDLCVNQEGQVLFDLTEKGLGCQHYYYRYKGDFSHMDINFVEERLLVYSAAPERLENQRYSFVNQTGELIVPLDYQDGRAFSEGWAAVKKNDKWGYIDPDGQQMIPFIFDDVTDFVGGLARVRMGREWGYINRQGHFVWKRSDPPARHWELEKSVYQWGSE